MGSLFHCTLSELCVMCLFLFGGWVINLWVACCSCQGFWFWGREMFWRISSLMPTLAGQHGQRQASLCKESMMRGHQLWAILQVLVHFVFFLWGCAQPSALLSLLTCPHSQVASHKQGHGKQLDKLLQAVAQEHAMRTSAGGRGDNCFVI